MEILREYYSPEGPERIGFVIGNTIVEVSNISSEPQETFMVSTEHILMFAEDADAFWHTHPGASCNLSSEDFVGISNWPKLKHYIVGKDGIKCYKYDLDREAIIEVDLG